MINHKNDNQPSQPLLKNHPPPSSITQSILTQWPLQWPRHARPSTQSPQAQHPSSAMQISMLQQHLLEL